MSNVNEIHTIKYLRAKSLQGHIYHDDLIIILSCIYENTILLNSSLGISDNILYKEIRNELNPAYSIIAKYLNNLIYKKINMLPTLLTGLNIDIHSTLGTITIYVNYRKNINIIQPYKIKCFPINKNNITYTTNTFLRSIDILRISNPDNDYNEIAIKVNNEYNRT